MCPGVSVCRSYSVFSPLCPLLFVPYPLSTFLSLLSLSPVHLCPIHSVFLGAVRVCLVSLLHISLLLTQVSFNFPDLDWFLSVKTKLLVTYPFHRPLVTALHSPYLSSLILAMPTSRNTSAWHMVKSAKGPATFCPKISAIQPCKYFSLLHLSLIATARMGRRLGP